MKKSSFLVFLLVLYYLGYLLSKSHLGVSYNIDTITDTFYKIIGLLLLVYPFLTSIKKTLVLNKLRRFIRILVWISILLLFFFIVFSDLTVGNLYYALSFPLILLNVVLLRNSLSIVTLNKVTKIYFISFIIVAMLSIATGGNISIFYEYAGRLRYVFGYAKPSYLSEIIIVNLILVITQLKYNPFIKTKWLKFELIILIILLSLSGSRTAILSCLLFAIIFFYYRLNRIKTIAVKTLFVFAILILLFTASEFSYANYDSGRVFIWTTTIFFNLRSIIDWIFGVGFGNAVPFFEIMGLPKDDVGQYFHIDGYYIEILIQQGVLGVAMLLIVVSKFLIIHKNNLISLALILSLLFYGLFESVVFNVASPFGYVPWLIISLIPNLHKYNMSIKKLKILPKNKN